MRKIEKANTWVLGLAIFVFLYAAVIRTTFNFQIIASGSLLLLLVVLYKIAPYARNLRQAEIIRCGVIFICLFLSVRYIYWRATDTMPTQYGLAAMICGLLLFCAEAYSFVNMLFGFFINSRPYRRKSIPLPDDAGMLPDVDVYIPTYNEDASILRPTVIAATQLRYPPEKLRVFILDDGGTDQKCNDPDAQKAAAARARAAKLKAIAERYGAGYITREKNLHAKSGNINNALKHTSGNLLVIFDCDHIPAADFLEKTIGFFLADPKLFLVQTPHNFVSPDPLEKNLDTYESSPAENELFYDVMQPGLDFWGTSFFCGSAAVLRRSVINELGGIAGQTITEDAETTIDALNLGYSTAYFNRPMVSGLQPETYSGFILQRVRWGQGMLQIFLLKNPWRQKNLKFIQKLLYTNFTFYWGFASARLIMLLAPPAFLVFRINLCDATALDLISYAGPALLASLIAAQYFYGRVRWPFMSHLYEVIQSVYITHGIIKVVLNPRSPSFKVTPKGEVLSRNFISSLTMPFYVLLAFNLAGIVCGVNRYLHEPWGEGAIAFVMFWALIDTILLLGALGVMFERRQLRSEPRVPHTEPVVLRYGDGISLQGVTSNVSASGISVQTVADVSVGMEKHQAVIVEFPIRKVTIPATVLSKWCAGKQTVMGLVYRCGTVAEERAAIDIAFGSSEQLVVNNAKRHVGRSSLAGFAYLLQFAFKQGLQHMVFLLMSTVFRRERLNER